MKNMSIFEQLQFDIIRDDVAYWKLKYSKCTKAMVTLLLFNL